MRIGVHGLCEIAFTENAKHRSRCMRIFRFNTDSSSEEISAITLKVHDKVYIDAKDRDKYA